MAITPQFTTVLVVTYFHDLAAPMAQLEMEGIESFTKDDLVTSAQPLFSQAVGGIKLQVLTEDAPRALEILTAGGYISQDQKPDLNIAPMLEKIDKFTSQILFIGKLKADVRVMILAAIILVAILLIVQSFLN